MDEWLGCLKWIDQRGWQGPHSGNAGNTTHANPTCTPKELRGPIIVTDGGNALWGQGRKCGREVWREKTEEAFLVL